jgi:hypothetical protein
MKGREASELRNGEMGRGRQGTRDEGARDGGKKRQGERGQGDSRNSGSWQWQLAVAVDKTLNIEH